MDAKRIGRKLSELRGKRSQAEIANALGISKSALSMYEIGERVPRDDVKVRLAKYYNVSIEDLFFKS
jgi:transcriptional regulator with XRE-family HTH domain